MNLQDAYDPEGFRREGHRLIDALADYLGRAQAGELPVLSVAEPEELLASLPADFGTEGDADLVETLMAAVAHSNHLHHPGYVGHQVASVLPSTALAELVGGLLNNGMAVYEMGQLQTVMERRVIEFMGRALGLPAGSDGVLTHGGSLGNLTALLAARQARAGHDVWSEGQREPLAVLVSEQAHYSVARAVQCMGWGAEGAVAVPTDPEFRLDASALEERLRAAQGAGRRVIAVVASCCSTATGSFDPLPEIADFCAEHGLWLHVDGAHGASLALSRTHRVKLAGVEHADSVVWDLHKMMGLPTLATAVLFREGGRSWEAFAQEAGYLFESEARRERWFDVGQRTLECTKRSMSLTAYTALASLGTRLFEENVDRLMELTRAFAEMLESAQDFELAHQPQANILCFRHLCGDDSDLDRHQARVRERILRGGNFYLVQSRLRGALWLRVTLMNPRTTPEHLGRLVEEIRAANPPA